MSENTAITHHNKLGLQEEITQKPLKESVKQAVKHYLSQLEGEDPTDLYNLVLAEVEKPFLDMVMQYTRGNQTRASKMLGLNRGTLRKKLKQYGMS